MSFPYTLPFSTVFHSLYFISGCKRASVTQNKSYTKQLCSSLSPPLLQQLDKMWVLSHKGPQGPRALQRGRLISNPVRVLERAAKAASLRAS